MFQVRLEASTLSTPQYLWISDQDTGAFIPLFRKEYPDIPITFFLRTIELDSALQALGGTTIVHGVFDDLDKIEELAAAHAIVLNCAASMNVPVTEAILRGAITFKKATGKNSVLYHLSGAGNFVDNSRSGSYVPTKHRFDDAQADDVRTITAANEPNGACDELIIKAANRGEVNAYFVCPGGVYGHSVDHIGRAVGVASAYAPGVWVDYMLRNIEQIGFGPYVGDGTSVFGIVHVDDVVALMLLVFQKIIDRIDVYEPDDAYQNWYNGVDKEEPSKQLATAFAQVQFRRGKILSPTIHSVSYEEAGSVARSVLNTLQVIKLPVQYSNILSRYIAGNMLISCNNSKSLGWQPQALDIYTVLRQL